MPTLQRCLAALPPLVGAAIVGGCAASSDYPSLSQRPIEAVSLAEPASRPPPPATPAAAAAARYAPAITRARAGDAAFRTSVEAARAGLRNGRSAPVGSENWIAAQQTISRLQGARAPVIAVLAELQAESEAEETRSDAGLANAANAALATIAKIDADEANLLASLSPRS